MNTLDTLFTWMINASLRASALVVIVLVVRGLAGNRLPARWRYALWLPVLAALVLPGIPILPAPVQAVPPPRGTQSAENVLPPPVISAPARPTERMTLPPMARSEAPVVVDEPKPSLPPVLAKKDDASSSVSAPVVASQPLPDPFPWRNLFSAVWLAGVLLAAAVVGSSYLLILRRIRRSAVPVPPELVERIALLAQSVGLSRVPKVWLSPSVASPAVGGWLRPMLLLNATFPADLTDEEADMVLRHELTHIRRGDLLLNPLLCGLLALHWFNPLLWLAFSRIRADREAACDADVLRDATDARRAAYGQTLLKMETAFPPSGLCLGFVGILQRGSMLRERIQSILVQPKLTAVTKTFLAFSILTLAVLGLAKASPPLKSSAFPLSLATLEQVHDGQFSFEEREGKFFVHLTDRSGDAHIHMLKHDGVSREKALEILNAKAAELATPKSVQLSIATDKPVCLPMDDIKVTVDLINHTDHTVTLDKFFSGVDSIGHRSGVKFVFTLNGNQVDPKYIHSEQLKEMVYQEEKREIKSEDRLKFEVTLNRWYQLDGAGEFTVKAQYATSMDGKAETLASDTVKFTRAAEAAIEMGNPNDAEADARRDLQSGTPKFYEFRMLSPYDETWRTILKRDYGVELVRLGCFPPPPESEYASRYNAVVLPMLKKKHGEDFLKMSEEKAKESAAHPPPPEKAKQMPTMNLPKGLPTVQDFQKIQKGMSRNEVYQLLGGPMLSAGQGFDGAYSGVWFAAPDDHGKTMRLSVLFGGEGKAKEVEQSVFEPTSKAESTDAGNVPKVNTLIDRVTGGNNAENVSMAYNLIDRITGDIKALSPKFPELAGFSVPNSPSTRLDYRFPADAKSKDAPVDAQNSCVIAIEAWDGPDGIMTGWPGMRGGPDIVNRDQRLSSGVHIMATIETPNAVLRQAIAAVIDERTRPAKVDFQMIRDGLSRDEIHGLLGQPFGIVAQGAKDVETELWVTARDARGRRTRLSVLFWADGKAHGVELDESADAPAKDDPIDRLIAKLLASHGSWLDGFYQPAKLPETATADEVFAQVFQIQKQDVPKILETRKVKIPPYNDTDYTAVLCQTNTGRKIMLLNFQAGGWWNRMYDVDDLKNEKPEEPNAQKQSSAAKQLFDLEIKFQTPFNRDFTMHAALQVGVPFESMATNGEVRNTVSGTLEPLKDGKYPLKLTVSEWSSEKSNTKNTEQLHLELDSAWSGGPVASVVYSRTVTLRKQPIPALTNAPDAIDRLVVKLEAIPGHLWVNGAAPSLHLPETATSEQVVEQVFKFTRFDRGRVTDYKILKSRSVQIDKQIYTAALVQTDLGLKIVLYTPGGAWSRVYDADQPATSASKEMVKKMFDLAVVGNFDEINNLFFAPSNGKEKELLENGLSDELYSSALSEAILKKFPGAKASPLSRWIGFFKNEVDRMTEKSDGDKVTLTPALPLGAAPNINIPSQRPITLKKDGTIWKIEIAENWLLRLPPPQMSEMRQAKRDMMAAMIRDVNADKYASFEELERDMHQKEQELQKKFEPLSPADSGKGSSKALLDDLKLKCASPAWSEDFEWIERPDARPANHLVSGEASAYLANTKRRLGELGVTVKWNPEKKVYEVDEVVNVEANRSTSLVGPSNTFDGPTFAQPGPLNPLMPKPPAEQPDSGIRLYTDQEAEAFHAKLGTLKYPITTQAACEALGIDLKRLTGESGTMKGMASGVTVTSWVELSENYSISFHSRISQQGVDGKWVQNEKGLLHQVSISTRVEVREVRKKDDKVEVSIHDDTLFVDVVSPSGIGDARLALTSGAWPTKLVVRLKYAADKPFNMLEGPGATLEELEARHDQAAIHLNVRPFEKKDGFEADLPIGVHQKGSKVLHIHWVDAYRN